MDVGTGICKCTLLTRKSFLLRPPWLCVIVTSYLRKPSGTWLLLPVERDRPNEPEAPPSLPPTTLYLTLYALFSLRVVVDCFMECCDDTFWMPTVLLLVY